MWGEHHSSICERRRQAQRPPNPAGNRQGCGYSGYGSNTVMVNGGRTYTLLQTAKAWISAKSDQKGSKIIFRPKNFFREF